MDLYKHLLSRNYDPSRYANQVLDTDENILTVYLTNLSGQFVGFQQYRPEEEAKRLNDPRLSRYFTYSQRGVNACWGLETLDPTEKDLYLVEGIFKASTLHMLGYNALALLTSHPKPMKSWLHTMNYNFIGIGDNDKAGDGIINVACKGFKLERDVDEYSLEELEEILHDKRNTM
jgi:hypothetical protein